MAVRPAAGGGRWVDVDPIRLPGWLNGFAARHGGYRVTGRDGALRLEAGDGTTIVAWPPPGAALRPPEPAGSALRPPEPAGSVSRDELEEFVVEAMRARRLGLLLARQAAVAVGVADGDRLTASKVETFYVQSRTAAGGWSQQRYARRRSNQARAAAERAAEVAVRLLLPVAPQPDRAGSSHELAALVTGGDRRTVEAILADPRLSPVLPLRSERFLPVGEPRHKVLEEAVALARSVRILVRDPPAAPEPGSGT